MRPRALIAAACAVTLMGATNAVGAAPSDASSSSFAIQLERLREALGIPGMAVTVVRGQEVVFAEGFGLANVEDGRPATPSTPFGLASVTKPIAATLIMQLVDEGTIDLDRPISEYGVSIANDRGITARHLLNHTSEGTPGLVHEYQGDRYGFLAGVIEGATGRSFAAELSERWGVDVRPGGLREGARVGRCLRPLSRRVPPSQSSVPIR